MKTPMQEVFAHLRASKEKDSWGEVYCVDWLLENEKSLLEKEKDVMLQYGNDICCPHHGDENDALYVWNQTFKTKEKMTPLQEHIETLKIHRDTAFTKADENEGKQNHYYYIVRGDALTDAISNAESMLEKEKEVMCEFADDYQRNCFQKSSDDYYNETFNTKEK